MIFLNNLLLKILTFNILIIIQTSLASADEEYFLIKSTDKTSPPVIGETLKLVYAGNKSLSQVARKYGIGHIEIREANPDFKNNSPLSGREILIPTAWIVPQMINKGILINLAELRLYFFETDDESRTKIRTFPIGIGRSGYETPTGDFSITTKLENPTWFPPKTSRKRHPYLQQSIPPGANNPLGSYWIQLDLEGYGIHGTNKADSIGKRVSLGCIRLLEENIEWLYYKAYRGMPIKIVNMPVKFGYMDNKLYMEVHKNGLSNEEIQKEAQHMARKMNLQLDQWIVDAIVNEALGIPVLLKENN